CSSARDVDVDTTQVGGNPAALRCFIRVRGKEAIAAGRQGCERKCAGGVRLGNARGAGGRVTVSEHGEKLCVVRGAPDRAADGTGGRDDDFDVTIFFADVDIPGYRVAGAAGHACVDAEAAGREIVDLLRPGTDGLVHVQNGGPVFERRHGQGGGIGTTVVGSLQHE